MRNKFFNKGTTPKRSNMELLRKSITEFCHAIAFDDDEAKAAVKSIMWDNEIDPALYWEFEPICTFEVSGTHEMAHKLKHNRLFGKNGILLEHDVNKSTSSISDIMELYELWLLEDMSLVVTFACQMSVRAENQTEMVVYRYPVENGFKHFYDVDVEQFADEIGARIYATRHIL